MKKIVLLIMLYSALALLIILQIVQPSFVKKNIEYWSSIVGIIGYTFFVFQFTYANSKTLFVKINRCAIFLKNPSCEFNIVTYLTASNLPNDIIKSLRELLYEEFKSDIHKIRHTNSQIECKIGLNNIDVSLVEPHEHDDGNSRVRIELCSKISYRDSIDLLNFFYTDILNAIKKEIIFCKENHNVGIVFENANPFYRMYIKSLEKDGSLNNFNLEYEINQCRLKVYNNNIEINSSDFLKVKDIAKNYFAISQKKS